MIRKTMKMMLVAVAAVMALGAVVEAAPKKTVVKPRTKHSSRVSSGTSVTTVKKPAAKIVKKKSVVKSKTGTTVTKKKSITARKSTTSKRPLTKRKPATKPR